MTLQIHKVYRGSLKDESLTSSIGVHTLLIYLPALLYCPLEEERDDSINKRVSMRAACLLSGYGHSMHQELMAFSTLLPAEKAAPADI